MKKRGFNMLGVAIAIISGMLMSVQGVFNEGVTKQTSIWVCASFVHLTALAFCVAAWCFGGFNGTFGSLFAVDGKYMLLGGVIGAAITYTVIRGMAALGPAQAVIIIVISQIAAAYLIELFGIFGVEKSPFEIKSLIGMALCISGILVFQWQR